MYNKSLFLSPMPFMNSSGLSASSYPYHSESSSIQFRDSIASSVLEKFETIMYAQPPQIKASRKVFDMTAKIFLSSLCYAASFSLFKSSQNNFNNEALKVIFSLGGTLAWGTLSSWSVINLYNDATKPHQFGLTENLNFGSLIYWVGLTTLGLVSEIPFAYQNWYFNRQTLFWNLFIPLIFGPFSILSMSKLVDKLSYSDNFLARMIHSDINLVLARKNLYKLISACHNDLIINEDYQFKKSITNLKKEETNRKQLLRKLISLILDKGSLKHERNLINKIKISKFPEKIINCISLVTAISLPIFNSIFTYNAYHRIINNNYLPAFISLAVLPSLYLQIKFSQKFYISLFRELSHFYKSHITIDKFKNISKKIWMLAPLTFISLALANNAKVFNDNVGWNNIFKVIFGVSYISTIAIILIKSTNETAVKTKKDLEQIKRTIQEKNMKKIRYNDFVDRLQAIGEFIKKMPTENLSYLLDTLKLDIDQLSQKTMLSNITFANNQMLTI